jgi:hypothetical protein
LHAVGALNYPAFYLVGLLIRHQTYLAPAPAPAPGESDPFPLQGTIGYNTTVTGRLPDCNTTHYWKLSPQPNDGNTLNIYAQQLNTFAMDLFLRLYEVQETATIVGSNDNGFGMGTNAWIKNYEAIHTDYYIAVTCNSAAAGEYTLRVEPVFVLTP